MALDLEDIGPETPPEPSLVNPFELATHGQAAADDEIPVGRYEAVVAEGIDLTERPRIAGGAERVAKAARQGAHDGLGAPGRAR